jgi:flavin-binding protein dodecin
VKNISNRKEVILFNQPEIDNNPKPSFGRRQPMAGSTYKIIELVGTSDKSWEEAAKTAIETAGESLRDLRIAEITKLDVTIENGKVSSFRARVNVSFKYKKD